MHFSLAISLARYTYQRAFRAKFSLTPSSSIAKVCPSSGFVDRSYVGGNQEDSDMVKQHGQNDTQTNSICQIRKTIYFKIYLRNTAPSSRNKEKESLVYQKRLSIVFKNSHKRKYQRQKRYEPGPSHIKCQSRSKHLSS